MTSDLRQRRRPRTAVERERRWLASLGAMTFARAHFFLGVGKAQLHELLDVHGGPLLTCTVGGRRLVLRRSAVDLLAAGVDYVPPPAEARPASLNATTQALLDLLRALDKPAKARALAARLGRPNNPYFRRCIRRLLDCGLAVRAERYRYAATT